MATTNFINGETVVVADWLNDVDAHVYQQESVAHAADTISFVPAGGSGLTETNVEDALNEAGVAIEAVEASVVNLEAEVDTKVPLAGGTLTGHLSTIAGATGAQVPRVQDVVQKTAILGTVSQSGGIPTGAIVETGSNANGSYTRFADGTQICSAVDTTLRTTSVTAGSMFNTAGWVVTFPAAFIADPVVTPSFLRVAGATTHMATHQGLSPTGATISGISGSSSGTGYLRYVAYGRWF